MVERRQRARAIARLAVRRGLVSEEQLRACTVDEGEEPDVSKIIVNGHLTHRQMADLGREAAQEEPGGASRPEPAPGVEFGKYVLLKEIGKGGMGTVWLASDPTLDRFAALKFLIESTPGDFLRFKREARTSAALTHPNIAAVYEFAMFEDVAYLAMQYIDGRTLAKVRCTPQTAARHIRSAAAAIDFAHRRDVIHRDLKPANLMVDREGHLFVMDFGLAKPLPGILPDGKREEEHGTLGVEGNIVFGTPGFMAPEQISGKLDRRVDVYGLGATLYAILAGRPPFQATSIKAVMKHVMTRAPVALRRLKPDVPEELDAIVMRCLQKEKARRYASARELGDDLDRFLRGERVAAHAPTVTYRVKRGVLRHRRPLLLSALVVTLLAGAAAIAWLARGEGAGAVLSRARQMETAGDLDGAEREYRALLKEEPGHPEATRGLELLQHRKLNTLIEQIEADAKAGRKDEALRGLGRAADLGAGAAQLEALRRLVESTRTVIVETSPAWPLRVTSDAGKEVARLEAAGRFNLPPGAYRVTAGELGFPLKLVAGETGNVPLRLPSRMRPGMVFVPTTGTPAIGFWIDREEATCGQYLRFIDESCGDEPRRYYYYPASWELKYETAWADRPVYGLDDVQAVQYLLRRGVRLPAHDEWARAGRGVDARAYPWGDDASGIVVSKDWSERLKDDVSPYGAVGLVSGPYEPVWVASMLKASQLQFRNVAWAGGDDEPETFRLDTSLRALGAGSGVRGAWTELPPEAISDPEALRLLMRHADAGIRAAALAALIESAPPDLTDDLKAAVLDGSPFVAAPAIRTLRDRGGDPRTLLVGTNAPVWKLFLTGDIEEIERLYLKLSPEWDFDDVSTAAALLYLDVRRLGSGADLILPIAEARWYASDTKALNGLYVRTVNRPGFDLNDEIGTWFESERAHYQQSAMTALKNLLEMERDPAGRDAFYRRYWIEQRLPRIQALRESETEYVRKAADALIEALRAAFPEE